MTADAEMAEACPVAGWARSKRTVHGAGTNGPGEQRAARSWQRESPVAGLPSSASNTTPNVI